jgi:hypothetical protein
MSEWSARGRCLRRPRGAGHHGLLRGGFDVVPTFLSIGATTASHPRPHGGWVRSVTCNGVPIHGRVESCRVEPLSVSCCPGSLTCHRFAGDFRHLVTNAASAVVYPCECGRDPKVFPNPPDRYNLSATQLAAAPPGTSTLLRRLENLLNVYMSFLPFEM